MSHFQGGCDIELLAAEYVWGEQMVGNVGFINENESEQSN